MNAELQKRIKAAIASTEPYTKARRQALSKIQWVLRCHCGRYIGMNGAQTVATKMKDLATKFDGRDNEEMKVSYFNALAKSIGIGCELKVELL